METDFTDVDNIPDVDSCNISVTSDTDTTTSGSIMSDYNATATGKAWLPTVQSLTGLTVMIINVVLCMLNLANEKNSWDTVTAA